MTHPFLFHPQAAPWFKESADTLQLTLFSELGRPIREVAAPRAGQRGVPGGHATPVSTRDRLQVWQVELPLARGQGRDPPLLLQVPHRRGAVVAARAGVSAAMPPREQHFRFNSHPSHRPGCRIRCSTRSSRIASATAIRPQRQASRVRVQGKAVISKAWGEPVSRHEEGARRLRVLRRDLAGIDAKLHYLQSLG